MLRLKPGPNRQENPSVWEQRGDAACCCETAQSDFQHTSCNEMPWRSVAWVCALLASVAGHGEVIVI